MLLMQKHQIDNFLRKISLVKLKENQLKKEKKLKNKKEELKKEKIDKLL